MKAKKTSWSKMEFKGEWAETLHRFLSKQQEQVPPGWITGDVALRKMGLNGVASGQRNKLLQRMTHDGYIEKKVFRVFDGSGRRVTPIIHYKLVKSP